MARIRSVHPQQWTDDKFVTCSPLARLLALAVRNEADDNGIFEWNPVKLKMRCLPADNCDVAELLEELASSEQVHHYQVAGKSYGLIRSFDRFQSPKKPTFIYPIPPEIPAGYALNKTYSATGSEPVPNQYGSGTGNDGQREGRGEEVEEHLSIPIGMEGDSTPVAPCPHEAIIAAYHELLPTCPEVREWHKTRRGFLQARWREDPKRQTLDWWRKYFSHVAKSDFLTGRAEPRKGSPPFVASLEWLVRPTNFANVIEGKYHNAS